MLDIQTVNAIATDKVGHFRFKKFDDEKYLITNDAGKFHFLNIANFKKFISGQAEDLADYKQLLKNGFIKNDSYQERMAGSVALKNHFV
jgi:hypothetical protein